MERRPIPAIVLYCDTCGLVRIADDYAHARATARRHLSGHSRLEFSMESTDRLGLAKAFEQRSSHTIEG